MNWLLNNVGQFGSFAYSPDLNVHSLTFSIYFSGCLNFGLVHWNVIFCGAVVSEMLYHIFSVGGKRCGDCQVQAKEEEKKKVRLLIIKLLSWGQPCQILLRNGINPAQKREMGLNMPNL